MDINNKFKNMILVSTVWNNTPSFRMYPLNKECLFVEGIYDPQSEIFVMISSVTKNTMQMLPKLDDSGRPMTVKGGKDKRLERRSIETFQEYYIGDKNEIRDFINMFAINSDIFDYNQYLESKNKVVNGPEDVPETENGQEAEVVSMHTFPADNQNSNQEQK